MYIMGPRYLVPKNVEICRKKHPPLKNFRKIEIFFVFFLSIRHHTSWPKWPGHYIAPKRHIMAETPIFIRPKKFSNFLEKFFWFLKVWYLGLHGSPRKSLEVPGSSDVGERGHWCCLGRLSFDAGLRMTDRLLFGKRVRWDGDKVKGSRFVFLGAFLKLHVTVVTSYLQEEIFCT